jgi:EF-hand domain pair
VIIYDYLNADKTGGWTSNFFHTSKDEIFFLQHTIGEIRACFDFVADA